jgi:hypothetical protein
MNLHRGFHRDIEAFIEENGENKPENIIMLA